MAFGGVERPRRVVRFARLMQRRSRVLGRPLARAASGGNPSLPWLPRAVVPRMGLVLVLGVFVDPHRPHPSPGGTPTVVGAPPNGPSGLSSRRVGPGPSSYWDELRSGGKAHPKRVMTATGPAATVRSTRQTGARSSRHRRDWQMTKASEHRSARRVQETSCWTAGLILLAAIMQ